MATPKKPELTRPDGFFVKDAEPGFLQKALKADAHTWADLKDVMRPTANPDGKILGILYLAGLLFGFLTVGAIWGFKRAYTKLELIDRPKQPTLADQPRTVYITMIAGALLGLLLPFVLLFIYRFILSLLFGLYSRNFGGGFILGYVLINAIITFIALGFFRKWQNATRNYITESGRYGNARFAFPEELKKYEPEKGFWIGGGYYYSALGHLLTVAGTRAGKGVNLILPNLLKLGAFFGSWVIVDPKGENAAVSGRIQKEMKKKVIYLNPWNLLNLGQSTYNPLDILKLDLMNLSDDVMMIAEAIVPMTAQGDTDHFNNRARTVIAGLLLHLVSAEPVEKRHLATLWQWLRLDDEQWGALLDAMSENNSPEAGEIVQATANEIVSLKAQGQKEYASVISTAQKWTDFLKSPALRKSLTPDETALNSADLADGNTVVYVIIPADRLKTHSQWLRLVTTSLIRAVIRKPNKDVCFLLDEFYALGFLSEINTALGTYAGFGVHLWPILQNLVQLGDIYGSNWENFISSCSVRHFFNVSDITTAEYVSKMMGTQSVPMYDAMGNLSGASGRNLINPDELRMQSNDNIYMIVDHVPPYAFKKAPYYKLLQEKIDFDDNPYQKPKRPDNEGQK